MNKFIKWDELAKDSKLGLVVGAVLIVILTIALFFWVFSGGTAPLFTNMDEKEAANVMAMLDSMKVPYTIENDGKNILVAEERAQELKLKLISQGVTTNTGKGFELFDNADIGMTEYSQKINYLRALQGELARSIMTIDGIKYARVHLVLPEASLFRQKEQKSTASVSIIPKPGVFLSQDQIIGIQRLVAAAAPGVKQDDVVVFNNNGITLSSTNSALNEENITTITLQKKREAELYFESKVGAILDKTFGFNTSIVTISVDLAVNKIHRKEETILPNASKETGMVKKRELKAAGTNQASNDGASTIEMEYQYGRRVEEIVSMPGAIQRIDVGVLVPENVSDEQLDQLRDIISRSVGLNLERGDDLSIYPMKIDVISGVLGKKSGMDASDSREVVSPSIAKDFIFSSPVRNILIGMGSALLLIILALIYAVATRKVIINKNLNQEEREKLLASLKEVLARG